jgi:hypothetical protein
MALDVPNPTPWSSSDSSSSQKNPLPELKISILPRRRIRKSQLLPQPVYVKAGSTAGKNRKNKCHKVQN